MTALCTGLPPAGPVFTGEAGRLTLDGVVWIVTRLVRRAGINPPAWTAGSRD